jgi:hypothetical protein
MPVKLVTVTHPKLDMNIRMFSLAADKDSAQRKGGKNQSHSHTE